MVLEDIKQEFIDRAFDRIRKSLEDGIKRGGTREEADAAIGRIEGSTELQEAAKNTDLIIEAVIEDMKVKKDIFKQLDAICPPQTILASNTSQLSITEMSSAVKRTDKFLGMHWMNPAPRMRGIEVIRTEKTSDDTIATIVDLSKKLGKYPLVCKDSPGFITSRLLQCWRNEGFRLADEGVARPEDIDAALKNAYNFRMGPFELADLVGIDILVAAGEGTAREIRPEIFTPPRCLYMKLKAGYLGKKTNKGFYKF